MRGCRTDRRRSCGTLQIFLDGEVGENAPALRHVADAQPRDAIGCQSGHSLPNTFDRPERGGVSPDHAAHHRGLAGAVAAQQRRDAAFLGVRQTSCRIWLLP